MKSLDQPVLAAPPSRHAVTFVLPQTLTPRNRRKFKIRRANPFGACVVFQSCKGVLPLCAVRFSFFFISSVCRAIWPFSAKPNFGGSAWQVGMAGRHGRSAWQIGVSRAIYRVNMAVLQGGLSGLANIAMPFGALFYARIFGNFLGPTALYRSSDVAFFAAGAGLALTLGQFLWLVGHDGDMT